jgi:energy-coupling factor transporter ATP-binding protein EcfA2
VEEDLRIAARTAQVEEEALEQQVRHFNLQSVLDRPCHALSGGEQRRVALAGALMGEPEILLFDEPFLELDYPSTREFLRVLRHLRERGVGVVVATHDYHRTLAEADRMVILSSGSLAVDAAPKEAVRHAERYGLRPATKEVEELSWLEKGSS